MTEFKDDKRILKTPITVDDLKGLHIGDSIYISGDIFTCRDAAHERLLKGGRPIPVNTDGGVIFHAGPIVRQVSGDQAEFEMISIGPTTSMRMEAYEYDFIKETGIKVIVGKGGMGDKTARACKEFGAIHCVAPAGCAVLCASSVKQVTHLDWADLGMPEALWSMKVEDFGPLIISIDSYGDNYFRNKKTVYDRIKEEQVELINQQVRDLFK